MVARGAECCGSEQRLSKHSTRVVTFAHPSGGIAHYSYCLNSALQSLGTQITSLTFDNPPYDLPDLPHSFNVVPHIHWETGGARKPLKAARNLAAFQWAMRTADFFHPQWSVGPSFDRINWSLIHRAGIPICYTVHDVIPHDRLPEDIEHHRWMHRTADFLFVHGETLKERLIEFSGVDAVKVKVIPIGNLIPLADFYRSWMPKTARASLGYKEDDFVVLFFGFIRPYKGLHTLIEACRIARGTAGGSRLRLLIVGQSVADSWKLDGYEAHISEAGLSEATSTVVEYVPLSEVSRYYLASDVCAVPYRSGSQSAVVQLGYAYSIPVIATDVGGLREFIQDGRTGLVVPPDNPEAFAVAISTLLDDRALSSKIGANGRQYAETELSWETIARMTLEVYGSLR